MTRSRRTVSLGEGEGTGRRREDRGEGSSIVRRRTLARLTGGLGLCCLTLASVALMPLSARAGVYFFRDRTGVMHFTNVPTDSRFRVLVKDELPPRSAFSSRRSPYRPYSPYASSFDSMLQPPADIAIMIDETAHRYGVETALVHAVVRAESDYDHLAVSPAGARGLMQLMPGTASLVGVRRVFEPRENLDGGVYYLRYLLDRFSGNVQLAVAAYNAGPGAVETYGGVPPYAETLEYVQRVFRFRQQYLRSALDGRLAFAGGRTR